MKKRKFKCIACNPKDPCILKFTADWVDPEYCPMSKTGNCEWKEELVE